MVSVFLVSRWDDAGDVSPGCPEGFLLRFYLTFSRLVTDIGRTRRLEVSVRGALRGGTYPSYCDFLGIFRIFFFSPFENADNSSGFVTRHQRGEDFRQILVTCRIVPCSHLSAAPALFAHLYFTVSSLSTPVTNVAISRAAYRVLPTRWTFVTRILSSVKLLLFPRFLLIYGVLFLHRSPLGEACHLRWLRASPLFFFPSV